MTPAILEIVKSFASIMDEKYKTRYRDRADSIEIEDRDERKKPRLLKDPSELTDDEQKIDYQSDAVLDDLKFRWEQLCIDLAAQGRG